MRFTFLLPNIEVSGGNRANFELANALVKQGHEVTIFYPLVPGRDGLGWLNFRKTAVQVIKGLRNCFQGQSWFPLKAELKKLLRFSTGLEGYLPDSDVIVFSWWAHARLVAGLPRRCGEPVHLIRSLEYWGGPEELVREAYRIPFKTLVTSEHLRCQYEAEFGSIDGIVPDGVDLTLFKPPTKIPNQVTVGMMYRRQPLKRMVDGIAALRMLKDKYPEIHILLFGESIKTQDRDALQGLEYEYVKFPTESALRDIYQRTSIFLFPSGSEEAFGLPPLEAMACGCAVVATKVGAIESYSENGQSALHCEVGNVEMMFEALSRLAEDDQFRKRLSQCGRQRTQEMSWEHSANTLMNMVGGNK